MAFNAKQLVKTSYGAASDSGPNNSSPQFVYRTTETRAQVEAVNYFLGAYDRLVKGSCLRVISSVGGTPVVTDYVVTTATSASVVIAAIAATGTGTGLKMASGQHTTVAASDTIVTGLATVTSIVAVLDDNPVAGCQFVTASKGDQAGAPAAGSALIKTWKATATADTAQIAATTFGKKVNWIAFGT